MYPYFFFSFVTLWLLTYPVRRAKFALSQNEIIQPADKSKTERCHFFSYFVIGTISPKLDQVLLETAVKLPAPLANLHQHQLPPCT